MSFNKLTVGTEEGDKRPSSPNVTPLEGILPAQVEQNQCIEKNGILCNTSSSLAILALEQKGFIKNGILTESVQKLTLSQLLKNVGLETTKVVWINGLECTEKGGKFYTPKLTAHIKIYPGNTLSFVSPEINTEHQEGGSDKGEEVHKGEKNNQSILPEALEVDQLTKEFSTYIEDIGKNPEALAKLCTDIWNPAIDPELCAQQQCGDTVIRILGEFSRTKGRDFGVYTGSPKKLIKMSNYSNPIDFFAHVFPKFSASHIFAGDGGLMKEVATIRTQNANKIDYSKIQPGDIFSVKHKKGGYHSGIVYNRPTFHEDIYFLSGSQYYKDITDNDNKFNPNSPYITGRLADYPTGFINHKNWHMYRGFGCKPYLNGSVEKGKISKSREYIEDGDTISIRRFDFAQFGKLISKMAIK